MVKITVIGAGAAGLVAAIRAAEKGAEVLVLEKMEKPARKIRITGKGRCNITNIKPEDGFMENIFPDSRFFRHAFKNFSNSALVKFLNDSGLETVEERGGRVFPASQDARDVAEVLVKRTRRRASIETGAKVTGFDFENDCITGLYYEKSGKKTKVVSDAYIVATGGVSYPLTGSTGDGYEWAKQTGHKIVALRPSLTGLELGNYEAIDVDLKNVELSLIVDGGVVQNEFGEMKFTKYGIDGPVVLRISRNAVDAVLAGKKVMISVNFKPALSHEQLINRIDREINSSPQGQFSGLLKNLLPSSLVNPFIEKTSVSSKKILREIKPADINNLIKHLTAFKFTVTGFRPFGEAIVTAGGIDLKDINPKTMCSKHIKNLFFAGEILNLDANTGGYNLQIAFSTGYLAGEKAAAINDRN